MMPAQRSDTLRPTRMVSWPTLPEPEKLEGSTIFGVGRHFFIYSADVILKLDTDEEEAIMTELAYDTLGSVAPRLEAFVSIIGPPAQEGILIARQRGEPLADLWPKLDSAQRATTKINLISLLVRMHNQHFDYYGRPGNRPYITLSEMGPNHTHDFCSSRSEWNESRIRALHSAAEEAEVDEDRMRVLEQVQHETATNDAALVNRPVLTHGDLSDKNILVDSGTLEITGLIDWELANVAPAYFEYATACVIGGHLPEWRKELLEVLLEVLRIECERESARPSGERVEQKESRDLFRETLLKWNAFVNVERAAQGYSDECFWTFEFEEYASAALSETAIKTDSIT